MGGSKSSSLHQVKNTKSCKKKKTSSSMKVVYISSPLMVTTSASKFMSLVQELTGRHSDITQLLENGYGNHQGCDQPATSAEVSVPQESPTSSESMFEPSEDVFMKDGFLDLLQSDLFFDASELDVLGSYDAL